LAAAELVNGVPTAWAGTITAPSGTTSNPYVVPVDAHGNPVPFTITGSGWTKGALVYIEVCDGVSPTSSKWMPVGDCDSGSEPAGAIADAHGVVSFPATNHNYALHMFRGESPQELFNCISPHDPTLNDDQPTFRSCYIRMTTSDTTTNPTDAFLPVVLPDVRGATVETVPGSATGPSPTAAGSHSTTPAASGKTAATSTKSSKGILASTGARIGLFVLVGLAAIVVGYGLVLGARRRRAQAPPE
jgi:hypothetical protein